VLGFRKLAAAAKVRTTYTDYAYAAIIGATIRSASKLNNAAEVLIDSTDVIADGNAITLRVEVTTDGKATFLTSYNPELDVLDTTGKLYGMKVSQTYTFDSGDLIVPNIRFIHGADVCDTLVMNSLSCGYLN